MTIAENIKSILAECNTFTIYGGYCIKAGKTVRFPTGAQEIEKRNEKGQVSKARYHYADGSRLTYTRKPDNGFSLKAH